MAQTAAPSLVEVPITGGMTEKVHPYRAQQPTLIDNARQWKTGSLSKRWGSQALTASTYQNKRINYAFRDAGTPTLLATTRNELLRLGAGDIDRVYQADATHGLIHRDRVSQATISRKQILANGHGSLDVASDGTYTVALYTVTNQASATNDADLYVAVFDAARNELLGAPVLVVADCGALARVMLISSAAYILYADASANLVGVTLTLATQAVSAPTTLSSATLHGFQNWEACTDGTRIFFIYQYKNTGTDRMQLVRMATNFATTTSVNFGGADTSPAYFAICADSSRVTVGYDQTPNWRGAAFDPVTIGTNYYGPKNLLTIGFAYNPSVCPRGIGDAWWFVGDSTTTAVQTRMVLTSSAGTVQITPNPLFQVAPVTKGFTRGSGNSQRVYVGLQVYDPASTLEGDSALIEVATSTSVLTEGYQFVVEATFAADETSQNPLQTPACSVAQPSASTAIWGTLTGLTNITNYTGVGFTGWLTTATFDAPLAAVDTSTSFCIAGGCPQAYDGVTCREFSFIHAPPKGTVTSTSTSGQLTLLGTYKYKSVYRETDARGLTHLSAPSDTLTRTLTGSNNEILLTVPIVSLSNRTKTTPAAQYVDLYRTVNGGTVYYYVASKKIAPATATVAFDDITPDSNLTSHAIIYTDGADGSALPSETPPSSTHVALALNRLWLTGTDDDYVWFSQQLLAGTAPQFSAALVIPPFGTEATIAAQRLDDKVILFKAHSIWFTFGEGPSANGTGAFASVERISSELGCVDPRGITTTVDGIWFNSSAGLCLLDRSLQVHTLAIPVEDSTGETQTTPWTICAGASVGELQETRFAVAGSGDQRAIVFDDYHGTAQQPVWYRYKWAPSLSGPEVVSACLYGNHWTWITTDGYVFQDVPGNYLDKLYDGTASWVTADVMSGTLHTATIQGWMMANLAGILAENLTAHNVTITVYQDWTVSTSIARSWTAAEIAALPREQLVVMLVTDPCQSVRIRFTDATPSSGTIGTGQGARLDAFVFEVQEQRTLTPHIPVTAKK